MVSEDIENLILYINSVMVFNANNEAWKNIFNNINGIILQATKSSRLRRSTNGKKSDDTTNENIIVEEHNV